LTKTILVLTVDDATVSVNSSWNVRDYDSDQLWTTHYDYIAVVDSDGCLHELLNAVQCLLLRTALNRPVPVSPVHNRFLSIQDIIGIPRPHSPSTRPAINLLLLLYNGSLRM